jgi:ATP-dependent RNA helicase SUPV3L1/SUV3
MKDRAQYVMAPVPWRDKSCLVMVKKFLHMHCNLLRVDLLEALEGTQFMATMLEVENKMLAGKKPTSSSESLATLERFHKIIVLYVWMSFRNPVSYSSHDEAADLKTRLEKVLDWSLEGMSKADEKIRIPWEQIRESRDQEKISYQTARELHFDRNLLRENVITKS